MQFFSILIISLIFSLLILIFSLSNSSVIFFTPLHNLKSVFSLFDEKYMPSYPSKYSEIDEEYELTSKQLIESSKANNKIENDKFLEKTTKKVY